MNNDEKRSKPKDNKRINEDFERKIFRLYDPKLKANLTNKALPPVETTSKKSDPVIRLLKPTVGDESDLDQSYNFADSETPIDSSDSKEAQQRPIMQSQTIKER